MDEPLSVIIPTHNMKDQLLMTLMNLMGQLRDGDEVLVVDSASTDGLKEMIDELNAEYAPPVGYVDMGPQEGWSLNSKRNFGIRKAKHDFVVLFDADCIPQPMCLENLRSVARVGAYISGLLMYEVPEETRKRLAKIGDGYAPSNIFVGNYPIEEVIERVEEDSNEVRGTIGCNCVFSREDAHSVGLFDPDYDGCYGYGETDFIVKLHLKGVKVLTTKGALAYHQPRGMMKRDLEWRVECLKKNRALLRGKLPAYKRGEFPVVEREA